MHRSSRLVGAAALMAAAVALLSACGGSPTSGSPTSPSSSASTSAGTGRTFGTPPAASGEIAEIDGNTLQVQNASTGQVAVTLTSKTTYTQTKAATRAAVTVGSCIVAMQPASSSGADQPTAITAASVLVTAAKNGSCSGGFGPDNQGRVGGPSSVPSGAPTDRPSGFPSGGPTGARRAFGSAISGLVTAINGSTITVRAERRTQGSSTPTTYTGVVTTTSTTKYSQTAAAHRADVKVGLCATVTGTTNSDGTVTAKHLALTPKDANGCSTGFIRQGSGPGTTNGGSGG